MGLGGWAEGAQSDSMHTRAAPLNLESSGNGVAISSGRAGMWGQVSFVQCTRRVQVYVMELCASGNMCCQWVWLWLLRGPC